MLTNIYYYDYYKPYMIRGMNQPRNTKISGKDLSSAARSERSVLLNRASTSKVIDYVRAISKNITRLKNAAKNLEDGLLDFNDAVDEEGLDSAKESLSHDARYFAEQFNKATDFASSQEHSKELQEFAGEIRGYAFNRLKGRGLSTAVDDNGDISFDSEKFKQLDDKSLNRELLSLLRLSSETNRATESVLDIPLAKHMTFKSLGYYYNYKIGAIEDNSFKIIESGTMVNLAL